MFGGQRGQSLDSQTETFNEVPSRVREIQGCGKGRQAGLPRAEALGSPLTSGSSNTGGDRICKAAPNCSPPPPPSPPLQQVQPAFAKQPGALRLCLSVLRGCYGSCFRRAFPANRRGFRVSLVPSTVPFSEAVGAQGQRPPVHGLTLPARPARPCWTHMLVPPREILTLTLSAPFFFAPWLPAGLSVSGLETLS